MLCYPANRNSNPVQRTQSISLSRLKPDAINHEQPPPRRCDYEIPVPFRSHLSVSQRSPFFFVQLDLAHHLLDVGWNQSLYLHSFFFLAP